MDQTNVGNMNGFYDRPYSPEELQRLADMNSHGAIMDVAGSNTIDMSGMMGGQSLDDIINQNNKDFQRRRIFHHSSSYGSLNNRHLQEHDSRRSSMLEFGSQNNSDLEGYQFDPSPTPMPSNMVMQCPGNIAQRRLDNQRAKRQSSNEELVLDTNFSSMAPNYTPMSSSSPYGHNLNSSDSLTFDMSSNYITNDMLMGMDYHSSGMDQGTNGDITPRNAFGQPNFAAGLNSSPMQQHMAGSMPGQMHDPGGGNAGSLGTREMIEKLPNMQVSDEMQNPQVDLSQPPMSAADATATAQMPPPNGLPNYSNQAPQPTPNLDITTSAEGLPYEGQNNAGQQVIPQYRNAYSSSGFDMLGVLMRVAARPNPQINIGAVDMSCAFVVCDATKHDIPIVYCSDVFERLTAYTKHEILGRNCRFLQGPDGKIQAGIKRKYVDDQSVLRIKTMITKRQESQVSLINYRKGGQPFMNLLTMIPITWDSDEIKYYVGFQVDLVEQPTSITNKNSDGSYSVSYQRGLLPRYVIPENHSQRDSELGQTVARDDVSTVLSTIGAGESELSKRIWDKVLLENTDDVVHVLSLKGLFLYLSPSSRKVLEYDPSELVGTALSSVCHPSDIVPVTRELKDTSTGAAVNVVFRIRRKHSGYTWFESHGSLHLEQGKGRKCIIMVGRERPVYALARNDILSVGGFGESELWTKMSTSGMFLFVSSNVRSILDRQPDDLFGTSAQALMRADSKLEFGRQLELACTGIRVTFKHDVQNKRGQTLQARTTIYPGDACEGQKPTFLVAQTRLLKPPRTLNRQPSNISPKAEPKSTSPASSAGGVSGGNKTPQSASGNVKLENITTQAGGSGLIIGNQHEALASEENVFDELKTTRSTSWQYELRQMEKRNRLLAEELQSLLSRKKKRKRRNGAGQLQKDCANCHTRVTPEWRRGPSGNRDLCNSCGLRWAKENGRVTPRTSSQKSDRESGASASPARTNAYNSVSGVDQNADPESVKANQQRSPQSLNTDSHNAKMARMEATASHGYAGGIPAKIEEGVETSM